MNHSVLITLSQEELKNLFETSLSKFFGNGNIKQDPDSDTLLDTKEAANLIKYKDTSIYGLVKRKKIPYSKVEGKLLFSKKDLLEWINQSKKDKQ
jgi:excisionase family DNA binding protein